jgi:hypothetical protein
LREGGGNAARAVFGPVGFLHGSAPRVRMPATNKWARARERRARGTESSRLPARLARYPFKTSPSSPADLSRSYGIATQPRGASNGYSNPTHRRGGVMATVIDAIRTVEAMAEIPCLRGGVACFDDGMEPQGWCDNEDGVGTIWVRVPERPSEASKAVEAGIAEHREELLHMLDWASSRDAHSMTPDEGLGVRDQYNAKLGALMAAACC